MQTDAVWAALDCPAVNRHLFFPRPDPGRRAPAGAEDLLVELQGGVRLAARYYPTDASLPCILHFHGNGEIVADYDLLAPAFHAAGSSLVCVDYRGYGRSTGVPTASSLLADAYPVLDVVVAFLQQRGHGGPLVVMGRSLGSAPAIELAAARSDTVAGLIIESGFARTPALLETLGVPPAMAPPVSGPDNEDKMAEIQLPLLILHAELDRLIPCWHAEQNYQRAAAQSKRLIRIANADHNTIIALGGQRYWGGIADFLAGLGS
jgi:alpha-beta hydrolase superfamily lysophospholipase